MFFCCQLFTNYEFRLNDSQRYEYDAEGRITNAAAYSGKQTKVEYRDAEGLTVTTYSDGTQSIIEKDLAGNIIRATNETGTIRYRYDAGGKLIEQTDEGAGETTRYAYDKAGRRVRMQSGNCDVHYRYGKNGELSRVFDNSQRLEVRYEYDIRGRETRRTYGNGVRQETLYDTIGRVILIREINSRNILLRAEGYLYDEAGRRTHNVDEGGKVTKYVYDGQSRLNAALYPWTKEKSEADRKEAEEAGLFFTLDKGIGQRYDLSGIEIAVLRELLNKAGPARGNMIQAGQLVWREMYTYDRNGNRATKTTPWGTIKYEYDAENRLIKKGDVVYTNDKDGNTLSEKGLRYEAKYQYNGQNRMSYSEVKSHVEKTHITTTYGYDALGRRTLTQSVTGQTLRTLYDGKGFEVIREGETFRDGSLTTRNAPGGIPMNSGNRLQSNQPTGERYRWISEEGNDRAVNEDGYTVTGTRYGGRGVTLYGNGEAVAVIYSSSAGTRTTYLGKDLLGSVRSTTAESGLLDERYEYDAFGQPYAGDLNGGMNLGYLGKPYDAATGLYNYGYRDYKPQAARFTTVDPIRDGNNWYAYVNNDPVNWVDLWGLNPNTITLSLKAAAGVGFAIPDPITTAAAIVITSILVADQLSGGRITQGIADFFISIISPSVPVRDKEGNPVPVGNQSPGPLGKRANAGPENISDPGDLGGKGFKPPNPNDPYSKFAAVVGIGAAGAANIINDQVTDVTGAPKNTASYVSTLPLASLPEPSSSTTSMTNKPTQRIKTK